MKTRTNQPVYDDAGYLVTDDYLDEKIKTEPKLLSSIVDNQGNPRFIEGEGEVKTIEGVTITYNKYSLSGTHLMFVLAGTIDNGTALTTSNPLVEYSLPEWIMDKIIPVTSYFIDFSTIRVYSPDYATGQDCSFRFAKDSTTKLSIRAVITATADRSFRIGFDLLIDTDAPAEEQEGE